MNKLSVLLLALIVVAVSAAESKPKALCVYADWYIGSTMPFAIQIAQTMQEHGVDVVVMPADKVYNVSGYSRVIIGGFQFAGKTKDEISAFIEMNKAELSKMPLSVFAAVPATAPFTADQQKAADANVAGWFKSMTDLEPCCSKAFASTIEYARMSFVERAHMFVYGLLESGQEARQLDVVRSYATSLAQKTH